MNFTRVAIVANQKKVCPPALRAGFRVQGLFANPDTKRRAAGSAIHPVNQSDFQ
jgi:hypothetical protein